MASLDLTTIVPGTMWMNFVAMQQLYPNKANVPKNITVLLKNVQKKAHLFPHRKLIPRQLVVKKLLDEKRSKQGVLRKRYMYQANGLLASIKTQTQQFQTFALQKICRNCLYEPMHIHSHLWEDFTKVVECKNDFVNVFSGKLNTVQVGTVLTFFGDCNPGVSVRYGCSGTFKNDDHEPPPLFNFIVVKKMRPEYYNQWKKCLVANCSIPHIKIHNKIVDVFSSQNLATLRNLRLFEFLC